MPNYGYGWPVLSGLVGGIFGVLAALVIAVLLVWSLIWKGMALWKAARMGHKGWFIALLLINTLGILDIFYIYVFAERYHPRRRIPEGETTSV